MCTPVFGISLSSVVVIVLFETFSDPMLVPLVKNKIVHRNYPK